MESRYNVTIQRSTPEVGGNYIVFIHDRANPLNSSWKPFDHYESAKRFMREVQAELEAPNKNERELCH